MHGRDWLQVVGHGLALDLVLDRGVPGEIYNIGGGATCSNIETVTRLCRILDGLRPRARGRRHAALIAHVADRPGHDRRYALDRSEEHTSELQSLMRISYAVFCLKKKKNKQLNK